MTPKVSITLPVYNVERYLRPCLDSIRQQTLREIQIICVNDGSTDRSLDILREYAKNDLRFEIIDKQNGGLSSARNAAYPLVRGKYLMLVDSDDWLAPTACQKLFLRAEQSRADMVVFNVEHLDENQKSVWTSTQTLENAVHSIEEKNRLLQTLLPTVWSKFYSTSFWLNHYIHSPDGIDCGEDLAITWQAVTLAKKIVGLPDVLYYYRCLRRESISNNRSQKNLSDVVASFEVIKKFLKQHDFYDSYQTTYHQQKLSHLSHQFLKRHSVIRDSQAVGELLQLEEDDWKHLQSESLTLPPKVQDFYRELSGDHRAKRRNQWRWVNNNFIKPMVDPVANLIKRISGRSKEKREQQHKEQLAQFSTLVSQLCEEIIALNSEVYR